MAETAKQLNRAGRSHSGRLRIPYSLMQLKLMRDGKERKLSAKQLTALGAIHSFSEGKNVADFTGREMSERYRMSESSARRSIKFALEAMLIQRMDKVSKYKFEGESGDDGFLMVEEWAYHAKFEKIGYLTVSEIYVLFYVISQCRNRKGAAIWKGSDRHIARRLKFSPSTVGSAIERLTQAGVVITSGKAQNKYTRTTYSINEQALQAVKNDVVKRAKGMSEERKAAETRAEIERFYVPRREAALDRVNAIRARARADEEYRNAENDLNALNLDIAKAEYNHLPTLPALLDQKREKEAIRSARHEVLGITEEDFLPRYYCAKCSDTGYLPDGRMCDCYPRGRR